MIVEQRTYSFVVGGVSQFFDIYRGGPIQLQRKILGDPVGYYVVETGLLNQTVHLWSYKSFEDRLARRAELSAEPDWQAFLKKIAPLLIRQQSKILMAAPLG